MKHTLYAISEYPIIEEIHFGKIHLSKFGINVENIIPVPNEESIMIRL